MRCFVRVGVWLSGLGRRLRLVGKANARSGVRLLLLTAIVRHVSTLNTNGTDLRDGKKVEKGCKVW